MSERDALTTRERILEATLDVLARSGPRKLSLSDVAEAAGVSRPTLYRWFPSKEELLDAFGRYEQRKYDEAKDNPDARCLPLGPLQMMAHPLPKKILQSPGLIVILHERMSWRVIPLVDRVNGTRGANDGLSNEISRADQREARSRNRKDIPSDGRPHLPDHIRLWQGDSIGRWEGDTLVVDTANLNGKTWLNEVGDVITHAQTVVERFTPIDEDTLIYRATVHDPIAYTRPWTIEVPMHRRNDELLEVACHEDNADLAHLKHVRDEYRATQQRN